MPGMGGGDGRPGQERQLEGEDRGVLILVVVIDVARVVLGQPVDEGLRVVS